MLPAAYDVEGKVVFITGAGRGIGRGIAEVLAAAGADIALNALTPRYVEPAAKEIANSSGRRILPVLADVTDAAAVEVAVETVLATFGRVDVLVNNLGDALFFKPLAPLPGREGDGLTVQELGQVMEVNLTSALLCTRALGPQLLARGRGKVINISATSALRGGAGMVAYTTAKTALAGLTRAQALEWAPHGIQVNGIAPGIFPDVVSHGADQAAEYARMARERVPLGRAGQAREVGLLALYLASSASDYMTGQMLYLDGGMSL